MYKENIQPLGALILGGELVLQLLVSAEAVPSAALLLVSLDVVQLDQPAEDDGEGGERDKSQIALAVVRLVTVGVDSSREDRADLHRHVVQAERDGTVAHRLRVL